MIRVAKKSDYEKMDSIFRASVKALCIREYDKKTIFDWAGKPKPERFVLNAQNGCTQYVKVLGDHVACFVELHLEKQLLVSLFVSPNYVGMEIGKEMIEFLIIKARNAGIKILKLDSSINAVNFYLRNGFIEKNKRDFTTQNGVVLESINMECVLST